jgi:DNA-binding CsgD family transcriptional regulator
VLPAVGSATTRLPHREAPELLPSRLAPYLTEDFVDGILDVLRSASFPELETLRNGGPVLAGLTDRERELFKRALHGSTNRAIAREMGISLKTVQTHRSKVNVKLGIRSPAELIHFGVTHGMLRELGHSAPESSDHLAPGVSPVFNLAELERRTIAAALRATDGNRSRAAALLGLSSASLYNKMAGLHPKSASDRFKDEETKTERTTKTEVGRVRHRRGHQ